jgi:hypothetical protein
MPFNLESAIAIRERPDGLLERDTFDLATAVPVEGGIYAAKPGEVKYEPPLTGEQKAQAVVELTYKEKGEQVPIGLQADWMLTSPQAKAVTQTALAPELTILQGIRGALDNSGKYGIVDRIQRGILEAENTKRFYDYIPGSDKLPGWAKTTANIGEDILSLGLMNLGKSMLRKELLARNISRNLETAANEFADDAMSNYLPSGYKTEEALRQSLKVDFKNRLLGRLTAPEVPAGEAGTLGTVGEKISPSILQNYASRKSLFSLLKEELGVMGERGSAIIPKIGQTVKFTNPEGAILKGVIKEITGQRAIIDMDGRQVVAVLSQLSVPTSKVKELPLERKQAAMQERLVSVEQAKAQLEPLKQIQTQFLRRIQKFSGEYLAEELKKIPAKYITTSRGVKPDEVLLEMQDQGIDVQDVNAIGDYLSTLDEQVKGLQEIIQFDKPKMMRLKETSILNLQEKAAAQAERKSTKDMKEMIKEQAKFFEELKQAYSKNKAEALEQEFANEDFLVKEYERDIAKLEKEIQSGEYQVEAEKAKAQARLDDLKQKYADAQEVRQQRKALKDEVAGLIKNIKSASKEEIAIEYQEAIDKLRDKFDLKPRTEKTLSKRESMKTFVERMKADGKPIDIPANKLSDMDKVLLKDMTLDHLRELEKTISDLGKLGKTKLKARKAVYESKKENIKKELVLEVSPINSKKLPKVPIGKKVNTWAERAIALQNYAQKTGIALTPIDGLADVTGMAPMKKALDADYAKYLVHNDKTVKQWYELTKNFTQENFKRIGVIAASRQQGGVERLANSGITEEEINAVQLTPQEEVAYRFVVDAFDKEFPAVKQYMKEVYNAEVGEQENYVSFMSDYALMNDLEIYERFGQTPEQIATRKTKTVEQGFTKERAKASNIKLEINIDKIFRRHMDDVAYMLNTGKNIKMYYEIINSPGMREKLGDVGTLAWLQWLDLMARKGGAEGAKRIAALDILRRNIGAGVLSFRVSSALVQFSSFADTLGTIGAEWATRGASSIATSSEWRNFIMDNFPEIKKAVGDDISFREFGEGFMSNMTRTGTKPLTILDGVMRSVAASGSYQKLCHEKGVPVDLNNPNPELVAEATKLMRNSQGSSFFKDQPLGITAGYGITDNRSVNKTILTFQSFMLNRWDNINRQIWRLGIKDRDYRKAMASLFWLVVFAGAVEEGIRRGARGITSALAKDKQQEQDFTSSSVLNMIQSVPLLGQLVSSITYSSNPVPVIKTIEDMLGGTGSATKGKSTETKLRGAIRAIGAAGSLAGVPGSSQFSQIIRSTIQKGENKTYR